MIVWYVLKKYSRAAGVRIQVKNVEAIVEEWREREAGKQVSRLMRQVGVGWGE